MSNIMETIWMLEWIVAVVALIGAVYVYGTWNHDAFKKKKFPFVASPLPFIGNMGPLVFKTQAFSDIFKSIYDDYSQYKYVGFFDFGKPGIMVREPESIKLVTVKDFDHFADRVIIIKEDIDPFFGKNLLSLEGQRWKDMRGLLSPTFTSSKMKAMFVLIAASGAQLVNHLERRIKGEKSGILQLDMKDFFTRYTNDVIATAAFGVGCDSLEEPDNEFYTTGKDAIDFSGTKRGLIFTGFRIMPRVMKFLGFSIIPEKGKNFFQSVVSNTIAAREKGGIVRPDMIHLMMQAKKGNLSLDHSDDATVHKPRKNIELTEEDITAQAFVFFLGGFDTSSTHLSYLSNLLACNPDVQERLQREIDEVLLANGGQFTYEAVQNMKYLDMCVSEALRLWPPGAITNRTCVKPYDLLATDNTPSYRIEKGVSVWIPVLAIHRDPQYFPNPDRFDPERFSEENKHNIQPYTYMPFGTGPRNCIGMRFALMESKIAIINILSRFDLVVTAKTPTTLRLDKKSFNMGVEGGFWLGIRQRATMSE